MKRRSESKEEEEEVVSKRQREDAPLTCNKWVACTDELLEHFRQLEHEKELKGRLVPKTDNRRDERGDAKREIRRRIDVLRRSFTMDFEPSYQQWCLFNLILTTLMPRILGPLWEIYKPLVFEELKILELFLDIHYVTPRQFGKTTILARAAKAILKHICLKAAMHATGGRTAKNMMRLTQQYVKEDPDIKVPFLPPQTLLMFGVGQDHEHRNSGNRSDTIGSQ